MKVRASGVWAVPVLLVFILLPVGYGMNLYKFFTSDFEEPYKREIVHGIGLLPVFGWFTGYLNIEDKKVD